MDLENANETHEMLHTLELEPSQNSTCMYTIWLSTQAEIHKPEAYIKKANASTTKPPTFI